MEDGKPSQTALLVAMLRARHYLRAPEPKILRDSLAMGFAGAGAEADVDRYINGIVTAFSAMSEAETAKEFVLRIEESVCFRARLLEEELATAKRKGVTQFVILGAGLDSTVYRHADLMDGLDVFEVDHPDSQKWKREQLSAMGTIIPGNLEFVAFDFENTTLEKALDTHGVDKNKPTVFSWLGVHMYLTEESVINTLNVIGSFPKGSGLVMDFVMPDYSDDVEDMKDPIEQLSKVVASVSEPFKSSFSREALTEVLGNSGLNQVELLTIGDMTDRYFDGNADLFSTPASATYLALAHI